MLTDIRPATPDDASVLAELIAEFNGPQGDSSETAARLAACDGLEVALIAWSAGEASGFACLRVTPAIGSNVAHTLLTELYVRPQFRRHGVASALIHRAESLAREQGATELLLFTGRQNMQAQAFYERLGFESRYVTYQKPLDEPPPSGS
jgi:GNAT superfamily N-acetyltransferase